MHRYYRMSDDFCGYDVSTPNSPTDYPYPEEEYHGVVYRARDEETLLVLRDGGPLGHDPEVAIDLYEPEIGADVIITHMFVLVVSGAIRRVVEAAAPGDVQFFRPTLEYEGQRVDADFWVMHPVHRIDCFVPQRSVIHSRPNKYSPDGVERMFGTCVIDRGRIDPSVRFGRLVCPLHVDLVRDDLRSRLIDGGVVGPVYQEVSYLDEMGGEDR